MRSYRWLARWQSGSGHSGGATSRHVRAAAALQPSNSTAPTESGRVSGGSVSPRSSSMASSRASCCSSVASHGSPFPPWGVHLPESAPLLHEPPRLSVARLFPGRGSSATTFPRKRPRSGSQPDHGSRLRRHFPSAVRPTALLPAPAGPAPRSSSSPPPIPPPAPPCPVRGVPAALPDHPPCPCPRHHRGSPWTAAAARGRLMRVAGRPDSSARQGYRAANFQVAVLL